VTAPSPEFPGVAGLGTEAPGAAARSGGRPTPQDWLLVGWLWLLAALAAVVSVFFLPLYLGPVPFPVSVVIAVLAVAGLPRLVAALVPAFWPVAVTVACWFVPAVWLSLSPNPLYGRPVGVTDGQWRTALLLGLGCLAAAATLVLVRAARLAPAAAGGTGGVGRPVTGPDAAGERPHAQ
jgi:hypothetical protein